MGARHLRAWLNQPTRIQSILLKRHAAITELIDANDYDGLHDLLSNINDIERHSQSYRFKNSTTERPGCTTQNYSDYPFCTTRT